MPLYPFRILTVCKHSFLHPEFTKIPNTAKKVPSSNNNSEDGTHIPWYHLNLPRPHSLSLKSYPTIALFCDGNTRCSLLAIKHCQSFRCTAHRRYSVMPSPLPRTKRQLSQGYRHTYLFLLKRILFINIK